MKTARRAGLLVAALVGVGAMVAGCADERQLANDMGAADFGRAVHEDLAAQIADPDAAYKGPPPPSSGERADVAQTRYKADKVVQPVGTTTSTLQGGGGGGGGS
jgi:type IV pilus biogenesis protein CpaD/CtpE